MKDPVYYYDGNIHQRSVWVWVLFLPNSVRMDHPVILTHQYWNTLYIVMATFIRVVPESESILAKQCDNGSPCNINTSILEHPVYCYGNIHQSSVWVYAGQTVWGWMGEVYLLCLLSEQCNQAGSGTWDCLSVYHNYVSMVNKYH